MLKFCSKTAWERNSNFHTIFTKMCNQIINCMPWKLKKIEKKIGSSMCKTRIKFIHRIQKEKSIAKFDI